MAHQVSLLLFFLPAFEGTNYGANAAQNSEGL